MTRRGAVVVFTLAITSLALLASPGAAGAQTVVATSSRHLAAGLIRTESTVQVGPGPLDRFQMVRLAKDRPAGQLRGSILFLPPLGSSFAFYEQRDPSGGVSTSVAGYFAVRGYDVYGYNPRYVGIPAGSCEAGVIDCSAMGGWGLQSMLDDIAFIRQQIETLHPGTKIVTGGVSLGGILAVAVANAAPSDYDGVIEWEGMLASDDPVVQALDQGYCAALQAQLAGGILYDGVGPNVFKQVAKAAELAPGGLNVDPLFPPTLTTHQTLVLLLSVPAPGPVSMPVPDYIDLAGSFADDRFDYASEARLFENVGQFNGYAPTRLVRDISCSLAGTETSFVSNLASFTGPVLAIGGGHAFGAYMGYQLSLYGGQDVTFLLTPEFGHIDHFMTPRHRQYVERPIERWVQRVLGH